MLDFAHLEKYRENNRIEAKRALGGLPRSIWETYSAFANTLGGYILLGVVEKEDKSLDPIDLPDPHWLIREFWRGISSPGRVSVNILSTEDVYVQQVDGKQIVVIQVPRADRTCRPVYIDGNPLSGTYRRSGEGDYRCTREEYLAMVRDASAQTSDLQVMEEMGPDVLDPASIRSYRQRLSQARPGHVWEALEDGEFLLRISAAAMGKDGRRHPTSAGLLMFGPEYQIVREFHHYFLDYREQDAPSGPWTYRLVSSSGDWSGNVYDFYFRVYERLVRAIPPAASGNTRPAATPVHRALREALINCLVNADYYGRRGVVILRRKDQISLSNPGSFRVEIEAAKSGGISDPRNSALLKMFHLIDVGKRTGSGIPNIFSVWNQQGWKEPVIEEEFEPDRITLSLQLYGTEGTDPSSAEHPPASSRLGRRRKTDAQKQAIAEYLTVHVSASCPELARLLGVKDARARLLLHEMVEAGLVEPVGGGRSRRYRLKA